MSSARALLALLGLGLLAALWFAARRGDEGRAIAGPGVAPQVAVEDEPHELAREVPQEARRPVEADPAPPLELAPEPAAPLAVLPVERPRAALRVLVVDAHEAPVEGARIRAFASPGTTHDLLAFEDGRGDVIRATTDAEGRATFENLALGAWWLVVERNGRLARERIHHDDPRVGSRGGDAREHRVVLDVEGTQARLVVFVVGVDGAGIEGALVEITGGALPGALLKGDRPPERAAWSLELSARTGPGGTAIFGDPGFAGFVVVAHTEDGRSGTAVAWTETGVARARSSGIEVVADRPGSLSGSVGPAGLAEGLVAARVVARLLNNANPYYTTHGGAPLEAAVADGRYRFDALPAGPWSLALVDSGDVRLALPPLMSGSTPLANTIDPLVVEIVAGAETVQDLVLERGGAIEGLVRAADEEGGAPLAGALVRATLVPRVGDFPDGFSLRGANVWRFDSDSGGFAEHPDTHPRTTTDAEGRYRLGGLPAGRHRLEVAVGGRRYDVRAGVEVRSGETVRFEHVLERAGAIEGVYRYGSYLGVSRPGAEELRMVAIVPRDGLFAFGGLEPGEWVLSAAHSDSSVAPVPLVTVTVGAGRTTWVDVHREATLPVHLTGRVVDGAGPIAGARVLRGSEWQTTDAQGRFDFGAAFPASMWVAFRVVHGGVEYRFELAGMEPGSTSWSADLVLGDERLSLVTRDALGAPAAAEIALSGRSVERPGIQSVGATVKTPPTGELVVEHLVPGEYGVLATFADGSTVWRELTLPLEDALVLQSPPSGEIEIVVRTVDGQPAPGRSVVASTWLGAGPIPDDDEARNAQSVHASGKTDADGRARLRGVTAGTVRVSTYVVWGSLNPAPPPEPQIVELAAGGRAEVVFDEQAP